MFRELLGVVARQLAPKCRDFSKVAKLARQCKWPSCLSVTKIQMFVDFPFSFHTNIWCKPARFMEANSDIVFDNLDCS